MGLFHKLSEKLGNSSTSQQPPRSRPTYQPYNSIYTAPAQVYGHQTYKPMSPSQQGFGNSYYAPQPPQTLPYPWTAEFNSTSQQYYVNAQTAPAAAAPIAAASVVAPVPEVDPYTASQQQQFAREDEKWTELALMS
ncbi:WW domain protein [Penicillium argentinense]|uniref:WW domain protein n=1 Tax=Penicillium argentinense TaxID=1131581 RepID=A0A9W9FGA6_9EURO|nr:WW domain protein [Penicillium argentinense]KAJ5099594.1 WW domain protein [Penicillium argentinense]